MKFLIFWILVNSFVFAECYFCYAYESQFHYLRNMLGVGLFISRGSASVLNLNCSLILLPVCRLVNSSIHRSLNFINRNLFKYWLHNLQNIHVTMAIIILIASFFHTVGHVLNAINASVYYNHRYPSINWAFYQHENPFIMIIRSISGASGLLMVLFLITMSVFSIPYSRKKDYVLFSTAHYLFLPFIILYLIHPMSEILKQQINLSEHEPGCESKNCTSQPVFESIPVQSWKWMLPSMGIYFFDLIYRIVTRNRLYFKLKKIKKLPGDVYELTLTGRAHVNRSPAQYVLLQCPKISSIEWHPFTVVSSNNTEHEHTQTDITVLMKACGDWTKRLARYLNSESVIECQLSNQRDIITTSKNHYRFLVDGAFFSPLSNILKTKVAFYIANGIGITPLASILNYLSNYWETREYPYRIHLVWVIPYVDHLSWIENLLMEVHTKNWIDNKPDRFNYKLFITKEKDLSRINTIVKSEVLRDRISIGRPDWIDVLQSWHYLYLNSSYSLYICGSKKLTEDVEQAADKLMKQNITFKIIKEAFT
ncbi:NADPH oxidase 4-like isoform X2 [Planococcus citri]|uniref:NADPH oxidase 4-like isoform X2 n=1 Tax=Planococcus citri TaxID=170843 RepID=UPI0031F82406